MLIVLGGLAELERDLIRARTSEGRERAKDARLLSRLHGALCGRCSGRPERHASPDAGSALPAVTVSYAAPPRPAARDASNSMPNLQKQIVDQEFRGAATPHWSLAKG
jgi:hypothetical protein